MKLWEVLKALEENPKKVFKSSLAGVEYKISLDGDVTAFEASTGKYTGLNNDRDWQEIGRPVPWQEAIEAWADGKKIRCKCEGGETFFRPSNVSSACFTAKLITHGTWYIED